MCIRDSVESDPSVPLSVYGRSKLAGEEAIQAAGCKSVIFRTSWVFGARGENFAKTILRLAHEKRTLNAVSYTHLRAHETVLDLVCRLLLEKKTEEREREREVTLTSLHHIT